MTRAGSEAFLRSVTPKHTLVRKQEMALVLRHMIYCFKDALKYQSLTLIFSLMKLLEEISRNNFQLNCNISQCAPFSHTKSQLRGAIKSPFKKKS